MQTFLETTVSNALVASVLGLLAFVVARWRRPALAHGLWLLVFVKLVTPPLIPVYLPSFQAQQSPRVETSTARTPSIQVLPAASPDDVAVLLALAELSEDLGSADKSGTASATEPPLPPMAVPDWHDCVIPIWLGGTAICLGWTLWSVCSFHRLLRSARRAPRTIQDQTAQLAASLGLKHCPQVWLVPGAVSPMIWAIGAAPRLLFPTGLLDRLDVKQRAALLLHELAHVRRRDHWVRFVELLVVSVYWWNPVVWWARRELREAEEQCCDAWVVWASAGEGRAYAHALLETVAFVSRTRFPLPASASGIGHIPHLRRRLTMIMQANTPKSLSAAGWLLLGLAAFALPVAARAQVPGKPDGKDQEIRALKERIRALEDAGKAQIDFLESAVLLTDDQLVDREKEMKLAADLKMQIAKKRAELQDLEAKLKAVLAGVDAKKGGKIKIDGKGKGAIEAILLEKGAKDQAEVQILIEKAIKEKVGQEKAHAEAAVKKALEDAKHQLKGLDIKVEDVLKGIRIDDLKIDPKDVKVEVILDQLKAMPEIRDVIIKKLDVKAAPEIRDIIIKTLDGKDMELKAKKLEEAAKARILLDNSKIEKDGKVFMDFRQTKTENIEARLERLMKELQELQKEVKASKKQQQ
jgi:beta-lactamase regulating signal transducer with metallopeptidase domain